MITIDGKDIKQEYGCTLLWGSFDSLLRYPKRVQPEYNNWAESDGIQPDLSEIKFEPRKIQLSFIQESGSISAFWAAYNKLYSDMTVPGYRVLNAINGITNHIRLSESSEYKIPRPFNQDANHTVFTLDFVDDDANIDTSYSPSGNNAPQGLYRINDVDFGHYGIGADENISDVIKYPSIKEPFTDGLNVFLDMVRTAHRDVRLPLWMKANSIPEFVNNYRSFFTQFNQTGVQSLFVGQVGVRADVYYSDCPSFKIERWGGNGVFARFTISLVIPRVTWVDKGGVHTYNVLIDMGSDCVLADEQNRIIAIV
jgi:hypothetical protein